MDSLKHRLKQLLREVYARVLFHTGLHALVNRIMPQRLTILLGHSLDVPKINAGLPADMKISADKLRALLNWFQGRYEMQTVTGAMERLGASSDGKSLVALTMDDGYRDNATDLLPLLRELRVPATVYLESRPLDERKLSWLHHLFWITERAGAESVARSYLNRSEDREALEGLRQALEGKASALLYRIKRVLKYRANPADRATVLGALFCEAGGDEKALAEELYLGWAEARELRDAGWELGGHTVNHPVLARLSASQAAEEIEGAARSMERELGDPGTSFAFPFGRPWDFDANSLEALEGSPYRWAVTTRAGTNHAATEKLQLNRIAIGETSELHLLATEVCGGFDLLRRFGLDLSQ